MRTPEERAKDLFSTWAFNNDADHGPMEMSQAMFGDFIKRATQAFTEAHAAGLKEGRVAGLREGVEICVQRQISSSYKESWVQRNACLDCADTIKAKADALEKEGK